MSAALTDIVVEVHHKVDKAVLVSIDGNRKGAVWLPLSAIEFARRRAAPTIADITLPERMAIEKGLV